MTGRGARAWPHEVVPALVEVRRLRVPLVEPRTAAHGTESVRESIVVAVTDDEGCTGWGECVALSRPTYTGEWIDGAWSVVTELIVPALLRGASHGVVGHPMAVAAVADASTDLALRRSGSSLGSVLGSTERVRSRGVLGIGRSVEEVVAGVERLLSAGHRAVKLKVEPAGATATLAAVRQRWPDLDLAADANGSFDLHEHGTVLRAIDELALSYLEQPFPAGDLRSAAALRRSWSTPLALDESASSLGAIRAARDLGAVDLVNLKPARWGGVRAAASVVETLAAEGVAVFVGGMYELGIARSVGLAVAAMPGPSERPTDLGPSDAYVAADVAGPHVLDPDGHLAVPHGAGCGPVPDTEVLERATTARVERRR